MRTVSAGWVAANGEGGETAARAGCWRRSASVTTQQRRLSSMATDGRAERFIRTLPGGWADGAISRDSAERTAAPAGPIDFSEHRALRPEPPSLGSTS